MGILFIHIFIINPPIIFFNSILLSVREVGQTRATRQIYPRVELLSESCLIITQYNGAGLAFSVWCFRWHLRLHHHWILVPVAMPCFEPAWLKKNQVVPNYNL